MNRWLLCLVLLALPALAHAQGGGSVQIVDQNRSKILDPCEANDKVYKTISQTTSTQLITGTASKKIYVCSVMIVTAGAENVSFVAGTGSVCGTSTVAVIGSTTAANGPNLAANTGFSHGSGFSSIAATTVNADNLCLLQSSANRIAGVMTYVVQ